MTTLTDTELAGLIARLDYTTDVRDHRQAATVLRELREENARLLEDLALITAGRWTQTDIDAINFRVCRTWSKLQVEGEVRHPCNFEEIAARAALAKQEESK
jgi:hypothetical protein